MMGSSGSQHLYLLFILSAQALANVDTTREDKSKLVWIKPGILTHQSLHSVLVSMEERLRGLEEMKYTTNRMDVYLKTFLRKLDSLDVRARAVQIKLEQLETVAQSLLSAELKNDLSLVHLQRKFETNQDRLIHKISLTENRLDSSITKFQGTIDLGFENIEKKQNEYQNKLSNINSKLEEISQRLIKIEDSTNTTTQAVQLHKITGAEESRHNHINRINDVLEGIEKHVNRSLMLSEQNDDPKKHRREEDKIKEAIRTEIHGEASRISNKINNMYDDLWVKTVSIESLVKDVAFNSNCTDGKFASSQSKLDDIKCSETIQSVLKEMLGTLGSSLQEKLESVDSNVEGVFATHKMILGAYNKMREDENEFETKLTLVLGKILDDIENMKSNVNESQKTSLDILKSHDNKIVRTVAYNTNLLKKMAEDFGAEHKYVETALLQLVNYLNPDKHESQEYDDTNEPYKRNQHEVTEDVISSASEIQQRNNQNKLVTPTINIRNQREDSQATNHSDLRNQSYQTPLIIPSEDIVREFDECPELTALQNEDETETAITKILMLYLKTLRGHLTKERFLYEANPQQPYSSIQDMVAKLKEKNFPTDFLKDLDEWDRETNDKDILEELTDKDLTDNPHEDYFPDKDYLD